MMPHCITLKPASPQGSPCHPQVGEGSQQPPVSSPLVVFRCLSSQSLAASAVRLLITCFIVSLAIKYCLRPPLSKSTSFVDLSSPECLHTALGVCSQPASQGLSLGAALLCVLPLSPRLPPVLVSLPPQQSRHHPETYRSRPPPRPPTAQASVAPRLGGGPPASSSLLTLRPSLSPPSPGFASSPSQAGALPALRPKSDIGHHLPSVRPPIAPAGNPTRCTRWSASPLPPPARCWPPGGRLHLCRAGSPTPRSPAPPDTSPGPPPAWSSRAESLPNAKISAASVGDLHPTALSPLPGDAPRCPPRHNLTVGGHCVLWALASGPSHSFQKSTNV